jgi:hypothetical protein
MISRAWFPIWPRPLNTAGLTAAPGWRVDDCDGLGWSSLLPEQSRLNQGGIKCKRAPGAPVNYALNAKIRCRHSKMASWKTCRWVQR